MQQAMAPLGCERAIWPIEEAGPRQPQKTMVIVVAAEAATHDDSHRIHHRQRSGEDGRASAAAACDRCETVTSAAVALSGF
jgi:hypothetical protein